MEWMFASVAGWPGPVIETRESKTRWGSATSGHERTHVWDHIVGLDDTFLVEL